MFSFKGFDSTYHSKVATESEYFSVLMWIENHGGLQMILDNITQHDLHHTVDSWLSEGTNFSIYPEQILNIINTTELDLLAIECQTDLTGAARLLAHTLPILVDGMSEKSELCSRANQDFVATGIEILCAH
jgi:Uncharacterized protein conserved in bacteria